MSQVLSFRQHVGSFLEQKLPLPVAYKLTKINSAVTKEAEFYNEKFNEIVDKYSKKDDKGNVVFSDKLLNLFLCSLYLYFICRSCRINNCCIKDFTC